MYQLQVSMNMFTSHMEFAWPKSIMEKTGVTSEVCPKLRMRTPEVRHEYYHP